MTLIQTFLNDFTKTVLMIKCEDKKFAIPLSAIVVFQLKNWRHSIAYVRRDAAPYTRAHVNVEVRWGEKLDAVLLRTELWVLKPAGHGGSGGIGNGQGLVMSPQGQVFRKGTPPDGQQCMVQ